MAIITCMDIISISVGMECIIHINRIIIIISMGIETFQQHAIMIRTREIWRRKTVSNHPPHTRRPILIHRMSQQQIQLYRHQPCIDRDLAAVVLVEVVPAPLPPPMATIKCAMYNNASRMVATIIAIPTICLQMVACPDA